MSKILFPFLLLVFSLSAQEEIEQEVLDKAMPIYSGLIYDNPDVEALFPGGKGSFLKYISSCVVIPEVEYEMGLQIPMQRVQFVVCSDGMITDVQLLKGTPECPECDEVFVRCLRNMPDWIPAQVEGNPVNSKMVFPIHIHIN